MDLTLRKKLVATVDLSGAVKETASWYDIYAATVAIMGICARDGRGGVSPFLGRPIPCRGDVNCLTMTHRFEWKDHCVRNRVSDLRETVNHCKENRKSQHRGKKSIMLAT